MIKSSSLLIPSHQHWLKQCATWHWLGSLCIMHAGVCVTGRCIQAWTGPAASRAVCCSWTSLPHTGAADSSSLGKKPGDICTQQQCAYHRDDETFMPVMYKACGEVWCGVGQHCCFAQAWRVHSAFRSLPVTKYKLTPDSQAKGHPWPLSGQPKRSACHHQPCASWMSGHCHAHCAKTAECHAQQPVPHTGPWCYHATTPMQGGPLFKGLRHPSLHTSGRLLGCFLGHALRRATPALMHGQWTRHGQWGKVCTLHPWQPPLNRGTSGHRTTANGHGTAHFNSRTGVIATYHMTVSYTTYHLHTVHMYARTHHFWVHS